MIEGVLLMIAGLFAVAAGVAFTIAAIWLCRLLAVLAVDAMFYIINRLV